MYKALGLIPALPRKTGQAKDVFALERRDVCAHMREAEISMDEGQAKKDVEATRGSG